MTGPELGHGPGTTKFPSTIHSFLQGHEGSYTEDEVRQRDTYCGWHFGPKPYCQTPVNWLESLIGLPLAESK